MSEKLPLVSVVMPMYNSAKFISQTLESLAYQTMKDFEVVVVDNCSTDNSVEVVESFADRLGGGLHVIKLPKNSEQPQRNIGIQFACGKYIAFLDSDDLYTKTALEEMTTLAEEYQVEFIHMIDFFRPWGGKIKSENDPAFTDMNEFADHTKFSLARNSKFRPDKPTFETNELSGRVQNFLSDGYGGEPYTGFYRRDFLVRNQITFPNVYIFHDLVFVFHAMCRAKKILRVPNITYINRPRKGSVMREQLNVEDEIHKSVRLSIDGFNAFKKVMDDIKFFGEHPDYRYAVLDWYINRILIWRLGKNFYTKIHPAALNPFVEREFSSDEASFAAYLFNTMNIQLLQLIQLQQENNALKEALAQK